MAGDFDISGWVAMVAKDMDVQEDREFVVYNVPKHHAAMAYVIRALANPQCQGSEEVLKAVLRRRESKAVTK